MAVTIHTLNVDFTIFLLMLSFFVNCFFAVNYVSVDGLVYQS